MRAAELAAEFGIAGTIAFTETETGLVRADVSAAGMSGELYLQGAQVTRWDPAGERPVIFISPHSAFAPGRAIRGGIPVIFPWFGPREVDPTAPQHGFARTQPWQLVGAEQAGSGNVTLRLALDDDRATAGWWPERFHAIYEVSFGATLELRLTVRNLSGGTISFDEALHSYFAVSDISRVTVEGLSGCTLIDKTDKQRRKRQTANPVTLAAETDSVYLDTPSHSAIVDPGWRRRIVIAKTGAASTIVWNPWAEKAAAMADLGAEAWGSMICVETGNVADNHIVLDAGAEHTMTTAIAVEPAA
jgi:glucose-6-phosphate 1-epimerase